MGMTQAGMTSVELHNLYSAPYEKRIAELEGELRKWRDNYAGKDPDVVPVPRYQIDRLLGE